MFAMLPIALQAGMRVLDSRFANLLKFGILSSMEPVHIDKLQVHPGELNENTGRIRIPTQTPQELPPQMTKPLRVFPAKKKEESETEFSGSSFGDLHRVWLPFVGLLCFVLGGIFLVQLQQKTNLLEKQVSDLMSTQVQSQKENAQSLERLKGDVTKDRVPQSEIDSIHVSLKGLKSDYQAIQKKMDSLNLKEVLIIDSEEATPAPASTPAPAPAEKKP